MTSGFTCGTAQLVRTLAALLLAIGLANGQSTTGAVVGTVTDPTGGVIAGVKVRVTNTGTAFAIETLTNASGDYVVPNLPAAAYSVRAEFTGFRSVEVTNLRLLLNQTVRADIRLEPGALEQSVSVSTTAPVVQCSYQLILATAEESRPNCPRTRPHAEMR